MQGDLPWEYDGISNVNSTDWQFQLPWKHILVYPCQVIVIPVLQFNIKKTQQPKRKGSKWAISKEMVGGCWCFFNGALELQHFLLGRHGQTMTSTVFFLPMESDDIHWVFQGCLFSSKPILPPVKSDIHPENSQSLVESHLLTPCLAGSIQLRPFISYNWL